MSDLNLFDFLDGFGDEPSGPAPPAPVEVPLVLDIEDLDNIRAGRLEMRRNYVHLKLHTGLCPPYKRVSSLRSSFVAPTEKAMLQKTVYVVPIPLPAAWLDSPEQQWKARAYQELALKELGFLVHEDQWEPIEVSGVNVPDPDVWQSEKALCSCRRLPEECHCKETIIESAT